MYYLIVLFTGFLIAIMVVLNGGLAAQYGVFGAAVIIHVVGSVFAYAAMKASKRKLGLHRGISWWLYLGGLVGVATTLFNNLAFGKISLTSIIALSLFGQTVTSLLIDSAGLFGMKKYNFNKSSWLGLAFAIAGMAVMIDNVSGIALLAVVLSFCSGITIVISRTINAGLSHKIGALQGSLMNHLVGLPFSVIALFVLGSRDTIWQGINFPAGGWWIYLGGIFGVLIVVLSNLTVAKIQSFYLTLLLFIGQIFTGIILDLLMKKGYSPATFYGGMLVSFGMGVNILLDRLCSPRPKGKA